MLYDIAVIGGGIAGHTAAQAAALAGRSVAHVMGAEAPGGLVVNVGQLEGFAGGGVAGLDLASELLAANADRGVLLVMEEADSLARIADGWAITAGAERITARAVILATGARLKTLDVPGAAHLSGHGVSQCGWCDGPLYAGRPVVVIGGGDAAVQEALHLSEIASSVTLVARSALRARPEYAARVKFAARMRVLSDTAVEAIEGSDSVEGVRTRNRKTGAVDVVRCAAAFVFIGVQPNSQIAGPQARRDATGALVTDARLETNLPDVFAVGAVRSGYSGRLDDAMVEAKAAVAVAAERRATTLG